jgi:hypothetical protein
MGIVALAGCSQGGQDSENADMNAGYANETVLPPDDTAGTDTLGNQMNQLNESDPGNVDTGNTYDTTNTQ